MSRATPSVYFISVAIASKRSPPWVIKCYKCTSKEDAMMITWTYSMTRYFSPGKSKTSSNWMMLGWSIAVKMEISLSIMCSFPWHLACNRENASLYDIWKDFEWRKQNKCEMHSLNSDSWVVQEEGWHEIAHPLEWAISKLPRGSQTKLYLSSSDTQDVKMWSWKVMSMSMTWLSPCQ